MYMTTAEPFLSMKLPPNGILVKNYKQLESYLQSSPELFKAYALEFGLYV